MFMYARTGSAELHVKTSNSCRQTESTLYIQVHSVWGGEMAADMLIYLLMNIVSKGMCLYIDVFRSITYVHVQIYKKKTKQ